ncbi:hypothetical protein OAO87_03545 [bacterium]|nr:hypothetical protein [bacterium]
MSRTFWSDLHGVAQRALLDTMVAADVTISAAWHITMSAAWHARRCCAMPMPRFCKSRSARVFRR